MGHADRRGHALAVARVVRVVAEQVLLRERVERTEDPGLMSEKAPSIVLV